MSVVPNEESNLMKNNKDAALAGKAVTHGYDDITGENPRSEYHYEQGTEKKHQKGFSS